MNWTYQDKEFTSEQIGDYIGFVYIIHNLENGMRYLGKKLFVSKVTRPPLKGKTRKRRSVKESDWKTYFSSNDEISKIAAVTPEIFKREILVLCLSRGQLSYFEAKMQFDYEVLLRDDFYNGIIQCRINRTHVKNLLDIQKT